MFTYKFSPTDYYSGFDNEVEVNVTAKLWTSTFPEIHTHDFWEILFVFDGSLVNNLDGQNHVMNKHDICLIKKENIHYVVNYTEAHPSYFNIMIRESYIKKLAPLINQDFFENLNNNQYKTLSTQNFDSIFALVNEALIIPPSGIKRKQALFQLAVTKLLTEFALKKEKQDNSIVDKIINIMSSPENMELSIAQIANKIGFSTEHVIRLFKKNGMPSPNQVFTQIKLDYACELLASSDYKTIVISELIGINNVNYFNKLFKKHIGVSPIEYRKKEDFTSKQQKAEQ